MGNFIDYIRESGKETFAQRAFTEVDNLVLAMTSYIDFRGIAASMEENQFPMMAHGSARILLMRNPILESKIKLYEFHQILVLSVLYFQKKNQISLSRVVQTDQGSMMHLPGRFVIISLCIAMICRINVRSIVESLTDG